MKPFVRTIYFFATLTLGLPVVASARNDGTCSAASLAGTFGFTFTGTLMLPTGPVPFAAVGISTGDAAGNFSATQISSTGGASSQDIIKGTATWNADCTGVLNVGIYDQSGALLRTTTWALVADDNGTEIRAMITSLRLNDITGTKIPAVVTGSSKRLFTNSDNQQ